VDIGYGFPGFSCLARADARAREPARFKYRLALVSEGVCILRYDNEAGKGDHRHTRSGTEEAYVFTDPETLVNDFMADVEAWRAARWEP
jgi:hypothetical protein